ncbi:hypothetical protein LGH82_05790 [Mesorhizobium sp. PAMC28654]|uniref:hypothetical protein n=1 Tax=Mesorhizobium sp. PAMC28654 TaxID=2880934 RepID=UPI001D0B42F4|nr:hypothetical protein [Mesorhizobium sp. PAMC28654]UDL90808.1 hypothetical protein LGH82_05790 [Mesorhizobium sp. PAMC28654]
MKAKASVYLFIATPRARRGEQWHWHLPHPVVERFGRQPARIGKWRRRRARQLIGTADDLLDIVARLFDRPANCSGYVTLVQPFHMCREPLVALCSGFLHSGHRAKKLLISRNCASGSSPNRFMGARLQEEWSPI